MISDTLIPTAAAQRSPSTGTKALRELIAECRCGQQCFSAAASVEQDDVTRRLLHTYSLQRARFASELDSELTRWKGQPVQPAEIRVSDFSRHSTAASALEACCEHDEKLMDRYHQAILAHLPRSAHFLVNAQFALARQAQDRVRALVQSHRQQIA